MNEEPILLDPFVVTADRVDSETTSAGNLDASGWLSQLLNIGLTAYQAKLASDTQKTATQTQGATAIQSAALDQKTIVLVGLGVAAVVGLALVFRK